jgi:hypothetical protein
MNIASTQKRWAVVVLYAMAMAWVEAAVVVYLRKLIDHVDPYQSNPLPVIGNLGMVELVREAATLVMLFAVGTLAGRNWRARLGYAAIAFGVWDIFYYVFLKLICGWPATCLDWDILFLLPLPWWGPVLAPMCIAALMIGWGTLASQTARPSGSPATAWRMWTLNAIGVALALYVFMADALREAGRGTDALRTLLPSRFHWPLFCAALGLMSAPIAGYLPRFRLRRAGAEGNLNNCANVQSNSTRAELQ